MIGFNNQNSFRVSMCGAQKIAAYLRDIPAVLVPIAPLEPIGLDLPIGLSLHISESITDALSTRLSMAVLPPFSFGVSAPFSAYPVCPGIRTSTTESALCDLAMTSIRSGAKSIFFVEVNSLAHGCSSLVNNHHFTNIANAVTIKAFDALRIPSVVKQAGLPKTLRQERVICSLGLHLFPQLVSLVTQGEFPKPTALEQWHRRGRDPEKLKKIAPDALFSDDLFCASAGEGAHLFDAIVAALEKEIKKELQ